MDVKTVDLAWLYRYVLYTYIHTYEYIHSLRIDKTKYYVHSRTKYIATVNRIVCVCVRSRATAVITVQFYRTSPQTLYVFILTVAYASGYLKTEIRCRVLFLLNYKTNYIGEYDNKL